MWSKDYIYIVVKCQPSCFTDSGREIPNFTVEVCSANLANSFPWGKVTDTLILKG